MIRVQRWGWGRILPVAVRTRRILKLCLKISLSNDELQAKMNYDEEETVAGLLWDYGDYEIRISKDSMDYST